MFTGLIEEVGQVRARARHQGHMRLTVQAPRTVRELKLGSSVAVSGVCLTAVKVGARDFSADLAPETMARTSLAGLRRGSLVNLELPMKNDGRFGGHVVQGHADGVGRLLGIRPAPRSKALPQRARRLRRESGENLCELCESSGSSVVDPSGGDAWLEVELPAGLEKYVASRGSIAIEGISLTVAGIEGRKLSAAIIPHTLAATNLQSLRPGDPVNVEVDILAKYAEKMLRGQVQSGAITLERLISEGF